MNRKIKRQLMLGMLATILGLGLTFVKYSRGSSGGWSEASREENGQDQPGTRNESGKNADGSSLGGC